MTCNPTNPTPTEAPMTDVTLIAMLDQDTPVLITANRETDTTVALTRGLAKYMEQQKSQGPGGRPMQFVKVYEQWPEQENSAKYPSALVWSQETGLYDASSFTVNVRAEDVLPNGARYAFAAEFVLQLTLDVWAVDPEERTALCAMVEDALFPVDWLFGARLILPHYHGVQADYTMLSKRFIDAEDDAKRRWRVARFTIEGRLPVVKVFGDIPPLDVRLALELGLNLDVDVKGSDLTAGVTDAG